MGDIAFDAVLSSDVPLGGGLSSSASMAVVLSTLVEELLGDAARNTVEGKTARALRCQKAEHEYPGTMCGIMDQFISALGQRNNALLIDCRSAKATPVPLESPDIKFLIFNSGVTHSLNDGQMPCGGYNQRVKSCTRAADIIRADHPDKTIAAGAGGLRDVDLDMLMAYADKVGVGGGFDELTFKRAKHVVGENTRCQKMAALLPKAKTEADFQVSEGEGEGGGERVKRDERSE